jgi:hypothetical protein
VPDAAHDETYHRVFFSSARYLFGSAKKVQFGTGLCAFHAVPNCQGTKMSQTHQDFKNSYFNLKAGLHSAMIAGVAAYIILHK